MAMTMSGTTLTFNDNSTQTTSAVYPPTWLGIGSFGLFACTLAGWALPGDTASGSYLFRQTVAGNAIGTNAYVIYGSGNVVNTTTAFTPTLTGSGGTMTPNGGTWRNIQMSRAGGVTYQPYENYTVIGLMLAIRTA
jgi:hypothetical protein